MSRATDSLNVCVCVNLMLDLDLDLDLELTTHSGHHVRTHFRSIHVVSSSARVTVL